MTDLGIVVKLWMDHKKQPVDTRPIPALLAILTFSVKFRSRRLLGIGVWPGILAFSELGSGLPSWHFEIEGKLNILPVSLTPDFENARIPGQTPIPKCQDGRPEPNSENAALTELLPIKGGNTKFSISSFKIT